MFNFKVEGWECSQYGHYWLWCEGYTYRVLAQLQKEPSVVDGKTYHFWELLP